MDGHARRCILKHGNVTDYINEKVSDGVNTEFVGVHVHNFVRKMFSIVFSCWLSTVILILIYCAVFSVCRIHQRIRDEKAMAAYLGETHRMCYSTCACAERRRILALCLG